MCAYKGILENVVQEKELFNLFYYYYFFYIIGKSKKEIKTSAKHFCPWQEDFWEPTNLLTVDVSSIKD